MSDDLHKPITLMSSVWVTGLYENRWWSVRTSTNQFVSHFYNAIFFSDIRTGNLFEVFLTVHHSVELFHQPTLMHNFLYSLTICLLHYYPRHVSSINMPIFRSKNCIHTASGIFALCKRLPSTLVESGLLCYIIILDMFRALTCPSSGGKIVFTQHLVSLLSVNVCTVHW